MSLPQEQIRYTEDQYLSMEREADERHEYLDGQIYAMTGESPEHGAICTNLTGEIRAQLKGTRCQAFAKDMRVRSGPLPRRRYSQKGLYSYPDLMVVCGELQFLNRAKQHWYSTGSGSDRAPIETPSPQGARSLPLPVLYRRMYQCFLVRFR